MNSQEDSKVHLDWYSKNRPIYKDLCAKVEFILKEVLEINNINYHSITSRAKDILSFEAKINKPKYTDPKTQITDLCGVRIICYVESDLQKICKLLETNFIIDKENSLDKSLLLGDDKVGYKSIHYVSSLDSNRLCLPEYSKFEGLKFEIQVRTILQHAWAEIEHDRSYKFSGVLPSDIARKFKLLAGNLELIDKEFDNIANLIDAISDDVVRGTKSGNLDFELNSTTLRNFLETKFHDLIESGLATKEYGFYQGEEIVIQELNDFGISTIKELDDIIPEKLSEKLKQYKVLTNLLGILRDVMLINDYKKYFKNCYKDKWAIISMYDESNYYNDFGIDVKQLAREYDNHNL
ncbi:hypothetical protein ATE47_02245 [Chryseobacterium sp. IHB B 17019]|jgi:ppGpp synthetase/RelA/SpoT-type nucleotidyltranferase|uniref:GTP pyrophosphokinase n=1 Tax=Chryseobacterium sp. IHB B 17019 TaxID=1721091 RepID=UPI00071F0C1E|nr:hypothetical protein [Chryseobacterium sp. IHB B 17019]ALR29425.1 hypothetical protein ATE47_02245 [Chryseobacterium sp. IHB B 17019]